MEAATATPAAVETAPTPDTPPPAATQPRKGLFKFSEWVHVGEGAEACDQRETGKCKDEDHFHAWVRLPNPYQAKDIVEKARAARARRMKTLRDPDSDSRAILEDDLDAIRASNAREILVDEMLMAQDQEFVVEATREVLDIDAPDGAAPEDDGEDGEPPKLYAHIDQDMEELARLEALPEDQRGEDYMTLAKHVREYREAVVAAEERVREPRRETLMGKTWDELIDLVRQERMENSAAEAYLNAYQLWQWFACTYKRDKGDERVFSDFNQMKLNTPPDVMEELRLTFNDLESRLARSRQGNS